MTTMIVNVYNSIEAHRVADALRLMNCVKKVTIQEDTVEHISGLPYTHEERIAAIQCAEADYIAGRYVFSDNLRKKHSRP